MGTHVNNGVSIMFTSNGKSEFVPRDKFPFTCRLLINISTHKIVVSRNFLSIRVVLSCFICSFSILKDSHLESDVCCYGWHFMIASISFVRIGSCTEEKVFTYEEVLMWPCVRGTQRQYSSKPLKHSFVKRILVFKR